MKKLNHTLIVGTLSIFAAGALAQGTPILAAQNTVSKFTVAQKSLNPEEQVTSQIYFVSDQVYILTTAGGTYPGPSSEPF